MCYGSSCKWEIVSGPNAGECRRPPGKKGVCDEEDYDDEDYDEGYDEEDDEDYDETPEDDYDSYDTEYAR